MLAALDHLLEQLHLDAYILDSLLDLLNCRLLLTLDPVDSLLLPGAKLAALVVNELRHPFNVLTEVLVTKFYIFELVKAKNQLLDLLHART